MKNSDRLQSILIKLNSLKNQDTNFQIFGSEVHKYKLNEPISFEKVVEFETEHQVKLPKDYVEFITQIGNGGAGPYYGIEPFENGLFEDLDFKKGRTDPSKPFPLTERWNLDLYDKNGENIDSMELNYFHSKQINGTIKVSNFGCGVSLLLVVNGEDYGNIWMDDRGNEGGIYPTYQFSNQKKVFFLKWYENWLDKSLEELKVK